MKEYKNYIFDLYGTLVDISTNERKPALWKLMADYYNVYGCKWTGRELSREFWRMDAEERDVLRNSTGAEYPEIKLERVFARLLFEVPGWNDERRNLSVDERLQFGDGADALRKLDKTLTDNVYDITENSAYCYRCDMKIAGEYIDELRAEYPMNRERVLDIVISSDWSTAVANLFRVSSRKYIRPYANTISTLKKLRAEGKGVYLLSNAQRIFTMPEIELLGLNTLFDRMYISSDYGVMKPEKSFMESLLEAEGVKAEEAVMVGNEFRSDIAVAMRCGVDSIYLNTAGYSKAEIDMGLDKLQDEEKGNSEHLPEIVMSGDIAEIR